MKALDRPCETNKALRCDHLTASRGAAQPSGEIQRAPPIPTLGRHRLTRVQANADAERKRVLALNRQTQPALELNGCSQCLTSRSEDAQRLVSAEFQQLALESRHAAPYERGEPSSEGRSGLISLLAGEPRVTANVRDQERPQIGTAGIL